METLQVARIQPHHAAPLLAGLERLDPRGPDMQSSVQAIAESGACFTVDGQQGSAVYVLSIRGGTAWVQAAKGSGVVDWMQILPELIAAQCPDCHSIGFQTGRPGLVKKAKKQGFEVTGWILRKNTK